jgi:DNA-binding beta-propeller fold protein YncE
MAAKQQNDVAECLTSAMSGLRFAGVDLTHFSLESHQNGNAIVHGGGCSAFLLIGEFKRKGQHERIPRGERLALRYVLTYAKPVEDESSRRRALRLVGELAMIDALPDHPSIVKPLGWFTTPQSSNDIDHYIGMYHAYRSGSRACLPEAVEKDLYAEQAIVVVSPLFDYVLYDTRNQQRSFVHCRPIDAARVLEAVMDQIIDAVVFLRQHCISHNDIKGDNIVLRPDEHVECGWRAALIDFGEMRRFRTADMILAEGEDPPGGADSYKHPAVKHTRCYKKADMYACDRMREAMRANISDELGRLIALRKARSLPLTPEEAGQIHEFHCAAGDRLEQRVAQMESLHPPVDSFFPSSNAPLRPIEGLTTVLVLLMLMILPPLALMPLLELSGCFAGPAFSLSVVHIGSGSPGLGADQFQSPRGLAVLSDGTLAVADEHNNRIKIVRSDGSLVRHIGTGVAGSSNDQFFEPSAVAALSDGRLAVAEYFGQRIKILSEENGTLLSSIDLRAIDECFHPTGMAVVGDGGMLAVADNNNHRVTIVRLDGTLVRHIGTGVAGAGKGQFNFPIDVAVLADGTLAVADQHNHRVTIVRLDGTLVRHIGTGVAGVRADEFSYPSGVAGLIDGTLAVSEYGNHRVKIVRINGAFVRHIGTGIPGTGDAQFNRPSGVAGFPDGSLAVTEWANHRVKIVRLF